MFRKKFSSMPIRTTVELTGSHFECINPMTQGTGNIWDLTLPLTPGEYEYKFTVNGWDQEEDVPLNGSCDFLPGDESANRGFVVVDSPVELGTMCYSSCADCSN